LRCFLKKLFGSPFFEILSIKCFFHISKDKVFLGFLQKESLQDRTAKIKKNHLNFFIKKFYVENYFFVKNHPSVKKN
jgi:hypothetical protein